MNKHLGSRWGDESILVRGDSKSRDPKAEKSIVCVYVIVWLAY